MYEFIMRILHVIPTYLPAVRYGGPTIAVHGLCRALAARGHRVEVFTTDVDGPNHSAVPLGTPVVLDGVHIRYFHSDALRRLFWSRSLGRALHADIADFDLVHLHSVFLWPTWAAARAAERAGIPYLISPRGMLVKDLIKRRNRFIKQAWISLIERRNLERATGIHVTSSLEAREIRRFGWRLPTIATIANGLDEIQSWRDSEVSNDVKEIASGPFVLFLGRLSWKKGLDRLLMAFATSQSGNLVIVGPDDEKLAPKLVQRARELAIADRVRILPRTVVGADKEYLYSAANVFVLPSYSENFGNSVLEAMQRGLPVVVTPEVGAAEIVRASGGGFVVDGEPAPLGAAVTRLSRDLSLCRSMGNAGKLHVTAQYGWAIISAQMEGMYAELNVTRAKSSSTEPPNRYV